MRMVMAISKMRARRIETVQGGRNWDDDELAQCLSRPLGGDIPFVMVCIQSGHILYTVTVALLQTGLRRQYLRSNSMSHDISRLDNTTFRALC
jgi:hypothetical protein